MARRTSLALIAFSALAAGCASPGPFPSLAPRAAERDLSMEEPVRVAAAVPDDPALRARAAALSGEAQAGDAAFSALLPAADQAVGRAGAPESEGWVAAQQIVSALEAARGETMRALRELDALALQRADLATSAGDHAAIAAARAQAERIAQSQQARLDGLRGRLRRP
jgi:hypothetical protein